MPAGTKSAYQSTQYWNAFKNIVETCTEQGIITKDGITYTLASNSQSVEVTSIESGILNVDIPSSVTNNGSTYQVTSVSNEALSNRTFNYVSFPSTITTLNSSTLSGSTLGALIWNANASLNQIVFNKVKFKTSSNFLLYVKSSSYAPSNIQNVVVGDVAQTIVLSDNGSIFYCPKEFTARTISYTHNYSMVTGGNGKGWESLALPFDVQKIEHKTKGVLTPFASYDSYSSQRPFWLYEMGNNGFKRCAAIKANTPYIISMPNNTSYDEAYIISGDVTFSASNVKVHSTSSLIAVSAGSKEFVPAFSIIERNMAIYPLNVSNINVTNSSTYTAGSRFISNLRNVYPFEAYMTTSSSNAKPVINLEFEETTGIDEIPVRKDDDSEVEVFTIGGKRVGKVQRTVLSTLWQSLPSGVYIVNGKKQIK